MSDELASKPVALECPRTGDTLVCFAERMAVVGGKRYLVAFPKVHVAFDLNTPRELKSFLRSLSLYIYISLSETRLALISMACSCFVSFCTSLQYSPAQLQLPPQDTLVESRLV